MAIADWDTFGRAATTGFEDAVTCGAIIEVLERGNTDATVDAVNAAKASRAADIIRDALFYQLIGMVARSFMAVRKPDDAHLRAMIDYLRAPPDSATAPGSSLLEAAKFVGQFDALAASKNATAVLAIRNKEVAHLGETQDENRPLINGLFTLASDVMAIWEGLAHTAGVTTLSVESQLLAYTASADGFWTQIER